MKKHSEHESSMKKKIVLISQIIIWLQQSVCEIENLIDTECQTLQFTAIFTVVHSTRYCFTTYWLGTGKNW